MTKKICVNCKGVITGKVYDKVGQNQFSHGDPMDCFNEFRDQLATKDHAYKDLYGLWQDAEAELTSIRMIVDKDECNCA